jgi:hypothetical protein
MLRGIRKPAPCCQVDLTDGARVKSNQLLTKDVELPAGETIFEVSLVGD